MRTNMSVGVFMLMAALVAASAHAQEPQVEGERLLEKLRPGHPRLFVDEGSWERIRERRAVDARFDAMVTGLEADAAAVLETEPVVYKKTGVRLLSVSREALRRILLLAFVYNVNGDGAYLRRAESEMRAVMAFEDWNPSHFLDVGEMAAAVAIGYDWLYDGLDPGFREEVRAALWDKALKYPFDPEWTRRLWWMRGENNWNSVCYGGLTMAMLVCAEDDPGRAAKWLEMVREGNPIALAEYAPDGVYPEGPGYWTYGTTYQVMLIAALNSALGDDMGLSEAPGFLETGAYPLQVMGPTGMSFNYSDGGAGRRVDPALFWFAHRTGRPGVAAMEIERDWTGTGRARDRLSPLGAVWWSMMDVVDGVEIDLPRYWRGRGEQPIAIFRSSWTDPAALFLATKGGSASLNHGHMDAGSFVFDAGGVRWATDLGAQNYHGLESRGINLWDKKQDSDRWQIFRIGSDSHNTLTIDGKPHRVAGHATMVDFSDDMGGPGVSYDLSEVFEGDAQTVVRAFGFGAEGTVTVRDTLKGVRPGAVVRWAMVTPAEIELRGGSAVLTKDGKALTVTMHEPGDAAFEWISADGPADYDAPNKGYRILIVKVVAPASGEVRIGVGLAYEGAGE